MPKRYWMGVVLLSLLLGCGNGGSSEYRKPDKLSPAAGGAGQERAALLTGASYPTIHAPSAPSSGTGSLHSAGTGSLESLGIEVAPGRIVIDTRKARETLEQLGRQLRMEVTAAPRSPKASGVSAPDLGIRVSEEKVQIDLNKTRRFLEKWVDVMRALTEEVNRSLAPLR
jgi:hypothetical protein